MSLLEQLVEARFFKPWPLEGAECANRLFYYTPNWGVAFNQLNNKTKKMGLEKDLSERGKVSGLINEYVRGTERSMLVRPVGYGMEPPVKRLRPPQAAVSYFRTQETRTFGFFHRPNQFYALFLEKTINLKAKKQRYEDYGDAVLTFVSRLPSNDVDLGTDVENLISP